LIASEIVNKVSNYAHVLRDDGVGYEDSWWSPNLSNLSSAVSNCLPCPWRITVYAPV